MKIVLPHRGEFGLKICFHVPAVHHIKPDIVMGERGESCLFPSAGEFIAVEEQDDDLRRGQRERTPGFFEKCRVAMRQRHPGETIEFIETTPEMPKEYFMPCPEITGWNQEIDVLLCPRWRMYGANKNWHLWPMLAKRLNGDFQVGAAGVFETIDRNVIPFIRQPLRAWECSQVLQRTIRMMKCCKLVVATDAGLAHLAMMCGAPLLLISHADGLVAPGPVCDPEGHFMEKEYWPIKMDRFKEANHRDVYLEKLHHGWYCVDHVVNYVKRVMEFGK